MGFDFARDVGDVFGFYGQEGIGFFIGGGHFRWWMNKKEKLEELEELVLLLLLLLLLLWTVERYFRGFETWVINVATNHNIGGYAGGSWRVFI